MSASKWKPYSEYKSTHMWFREFPKHWSLKKIKHLFRIHNGATPKSSNSDFWGGEMNWVTPNDLGSLEGIEIGETSRKITPQGYSSCGTSSAKAGSIAISTRAPIGHLAITTADMSCNQGCRLLEPIDEAEIKYFHAFLEASVSELKSLGQGSTFKELPSHRLENLPTMLPSTQEFIAITDFLQTNRINISELIENLKLKLLLLEEKRSALITQAVTKGLNPNTRTKDSGIEWLGDIPSHWTVMRMRFLCEITTGGRDTQDAEDEGEFPFFVRSPHIEKISTYSFDGEAVLTSGDGAGVGKIYHHYIGKLDFHQRVYLFSNFNHIKGRLFYFFIRENLKTEVLSLSAKSTVDSIRLPMLQNFPIAYGSEKEQMEILNHVERVDKLTNQLVEKTRRKITLLREYRTAIISAAVTGKIDVRGL